MKRKCVLLLLLAAVLVLALAASAVAAPAPPTIEVIGSGVVPLVATGTGTGTATVTVDARSIGKAALLPTPYPYWSSKAKGSVTIAVDDGGPTITGRVTHLSTMYEIARGVSIVFKYRGVDYDMYITEDFDRLGDGVWFNLIDLIGYRTLYSPADLVSGGFDLNYPTPEAP